MKPAYLYSAIITRVIDGDTLEADVDLGFRVWQRGIRLRLLAVNCPEMNTPEGKAAKKFTEETLTLHAPIVVIESVKPDKYGGRWNATVYLAGQDKPLNSILIDSGHAKPYP